MTGEVFDSHEYVSHFPIVTPFADTFLSVISVTTWSAILSASDAQRNRMGGNSRGSLRKDVADSRGGSWLGFFFKLLLFAGVCVGATYGYKTYVLNQRRNYGGSPFGGLGYESRRQF